MSGLSSEGGIDGPGAVLPAMVGSISDLQQRLADQHYVADRGLAVSLFLALRLKRPLFLEGEAGVGKTALAGAVAAALGTDLIRLQCYEGLDVGHALYEWDYARQLLELRILDATHTLDRESARRELYSEAFLIKRPLLQAIDPLRTRPAVLLIDEIDRADEEFEGFLLELLAEFQITIPELGTVRATEPPLVVLTSNRTREVHDALKRRCLYQWIEYPSFEKELAIVRERAPEASARLAEQVTAMVQELRARRPVQGARRVGDHRLGDRARRARQGHARCRRDRRNPRRRAESEGRSGGAPRTPGGGAARSRDRAKRVAGVKRAGPMSRLLDNLLIFGRVLRRAGIDVHPGRLLDVIEALGHVNLGARDEVYHTCRALLVHRQEQIAIFDRAFAAFWREHHEGEAATRRRGPTSRAPPRSRSRKSSRPMSSATPPEPTRQKATRRRQKAA